MSFSLASSVDALALSIKATILYFLLYKTKQGCPPLVLVSPEWPSGYKYRVRNSWVKLSLDPLIKIQRMPLKERYTWFYILLRVKNIVTKHTWAEHVSLALKWFFEENYSRRDSVAGRVSRVGSRTHEKRPESSKIKDLVKGQPMDFFQRIWARNPLNSSYIVRSPTIM